MAVRVDPSSPEPLFSQVVAAIKRDVATGRLKPGDRLPPVRELARDLVINPNTIARAYQVLESEGVTRSRRGAGTFVADRKVTEKRSERLRRFREAMEAVLSDAVHMGLSRKDVEKGFSDAVERFLFARKQGRS